MTTDIADKQTLGQPQIALFVCACILFIAGIGLGYSSEPASAAATLAAGVLCLIFAFLSRFKRFKGLGIEAELWEQKQEEAARLIQVMRSLSAAVAGQLISVSARMGRWDSGITRQEMYDLVAKLDEVLKDVGVSSDQRETFKADFYRYTAIDLAHPISKAINHAIDAKHAEQQKVVKSFGKPPSDTEAYNNAVERARAISGQKVDWERIVKLAPNRAFYDAFPKTINDADCLSSDERAELVASISDEMADLEEWVTKRRLRRPEHWFASEED